MTPIARTKIDRRIRERAFESQVHRVDGPVADRTRLGRKPNVELTARELEELSLEEALDLVVALPRPVDHDADPNDGLLGAGRDASEKEGAHNDSRKRVDRQTGKCPAAQYSPPISSAVYGREASQARSSSRDDDERPNGLPGDDVSRPELDVDESERRPGISKSVLPVSDDDRFHDFALERYFDSSLAGGVSRAHDELHAVSHRENVESRLADHGRSFRECVERPIDSIVPSRSQARRNLRQDDGAEDQAQKHCDRKLKAKTDAIVPSHHHDRQDDEERLEWGT